MCVRVCLNVSMSVSACSCFHSASKNSTRSFFLKVSAATITTLSTKCLFRTAPTRSSFACRDY